MSPSEGREKERDVQCDGDSDRQTNPPETEASITSLEIVVYIAYMQTTKRESWGNNGNVANQSQTYLYTHLLVLYIQIYLYTRWGIFWAIFVWTTKRKAINHVAKSRCHDQIIKKIKKNNIANNTGYFKRQQS